MLLPKPGVTKDLGGSGTLGRNDVEHMAKEFFHFRGYQLPALENVGQFIKIGSYYIKTIKIFTPVSRSTLPLPIRVKIVSGESFGVDAKGVRPSSMIYNKTPNDQISQLKEKMFV